MSLYINNFVQFSKPALILNSLINSFTQLLNLVGQISLVYFGYSWVFLFYIKLRKKESIKLKENTLNFVWNCT